MTLPLNPAMAATDAPPVMEARRWLQGVVFPADRPLINVSQAAPVEPPPLALRQAIADAALGDDAAHLYGPVLGLPDLRAEIAAQWSVAYGGQIGALEVAITQGCNQAFTAVMSTLAGAGDEVILPTPWYFNHKMWFDMQAVCTVALDTGPTLIPDAEAARALITSRTRAIVLVSPNNPGGVEYPAATLSAFRDLCRSHGLALIVDETYRDFDSRHSVEMGGRPHDLFIDPDWSDTLVHLYSFSKAYRLTGHRVGAIVASAQRLAEVEKFLDTVAICPGQLGQIAALWGMRNLRQWVAGERDEILSRRRAMVDGFAQLEGWQLLGCGAYFAYVEHPFDLPSDQLCKRLVSEASLLMLPGTMFQPAGSQAGKRQIRIAFANVDTAGIAELFRRLKAFHA
ncbi:MAG: aminotransferase [Pseudotabrizicola sp.]|uniref:aminotransferase n=1 Tax=Pseudotabrizicola sp. TaxID=2939647 RepID=UPI0027203E6F|nr:aminotransferase [Pseudotabrizicola sp.]MDO8884803.1 aminotransferase [Pseudotabrizicola sp.]MDP2080416.1 aminotransferase [Pseudotabrizicola sp.]MDZ7573740.1 aminotransferase [Pseudotabrizicola sp.]